MRRWNPTGRSRAPAQLWDNLGFANPLVFRMSTESLTPTAPEFPITDEVRHALAVAKRGADELLIE